MVVEAQRQAAGKGSYCGAVWAAGLVTWSRQAAGSGWPRWRVGGGPGRGQGQGQEGCSLHILTPRGAHHLTPHRHQRGYFFLGKKLNLFSLSFLPRLASRPAMEGRGRLWALTRMLWDSLMAVLKPCSQDSISSCRVGKVRAPAMTLGLPL